MPPSRNLEDDLLSDDTGPEKPKKVTPLPDLKNMKAELRNIEIRLTSDLNAVCEQYGVKVGYLSLPEKTNGELSDFEMRYGVTVSIDWKDGRAFLNFSGTAS